MHVVDPVYEPLYSLFNLSFCSALIPENTHNLTHICCCCVCPAHAGCTVAAQLLRCDLTAPFPKTLTLTAKGTKAGTFTNKVEVRSPDSTAMDEADVTIIPVNVETCATWVNKNGCGAGQVLNDNNAGRVLNDTSNAAAVKLICCVSGPARTAVHTLG
jgi:hypothetical protein